MASHRSGTRPPAWATQTPSTSVPFPKEPRSLGHQGHSFSSGPGSLLRITAGLGLVAGPAGWHESCLLKTGNKGRKERKPRKGRQQAEVQCAEGVGMRATREKTHSFPSVCSRTPHTSTLAGEVYLHASAVEFTVSQQLGASENLPA